MRTLRALLCAPLLLAGCSTGASDAPSDASDVAPRFGGGTPNVKLLRMATLSAPTALAMRPGDNGAYYIAEKAGRVRRLEGRRVTHTVLDIRDRVGSGGYEQGLLGIAFSPNGSRLYVNYTDNSGDTRILWYRMDGNRARTGTRRLLMVVAQPYDNHNGGDIHIGPDGMLYIALGDGGSGGDPEGNGQDKSTLLGSILRIDPTPTGDRRYSNPSDNPFVGRAGRDEILHYGVRNPWRIHIDKGSNTLWVADVGQSAWEEINRVPLGARGKNFGWNRMEGRHTYGGRTEPSNHRGPIFEYSHAGGRCSITGGVVARDRRIPGLVGKYLFGDFCDGVLKALRKTDSGWRAQALGLNVPQVSAFGVGPNKRVFVLSLAGNVYRIDPD